MSGSISLSMSQQLDEFGKPLAGGLLYFIEAGTTSTPQNAYQDSALTLPWPNPIELDSAGRVPQFYLADGTIKIRLTDSNGVQQLVADNILVVGPSSGSGGGGTVDATTVLATGDIKVKYGTGTLSGFVRANGRTIGSATSGATERANADAQSLFEYLWGADANLAVSGGRGASAAVDWSANKTITLPDWRGRVIGGLDDMGNIAAGRLSSTYFGTSPTTVGAASSSQTAALVAANNGPHSHGVYLNDPGHTHAVNGRDIVVQNGSGGGYHVLVPDNGNTGALATFGNTTGMGIGSSPGSTNNSVTSQGSGTPFSIIQPTLLTTIYIKL